MSNIITNNSNNNNNSIFLFGKNNNIMQEMNDNNDYDLYYDYENTSSFDTIMEEQMYLEKKSMQLLERISISSADESINLKNLKFEFYKDNNNNINDENNDENSSYFNSFQIDIDDFEDENIIKDKENEDEDENMYIFEIDDI